MKSRLALLVPIAAMAVAACSAEESATPATLAPTSVESTSSVAPSTTDPTPVTTGAETTTSAPETTTTVPPTTAPPTTVAPPSGDPTDDAVPVFAGGADDAWLYLGRWNGSAWEGPFDADDAPVDPAFATNATVAISDLTRGEREGSGGAAAESCSDGRTGPTITPNAGAPDDPEFGFSAIAAPVDWPLRPRQVAAVDADIESYAAAGVAAFADDDVETQAGEIDQIVVADLDGDGDAQVLVVFGDESESEGDTVDPGFSGLLLIDADSGDATTLAKSFIPLSIEEGEVASFDTYRVLDVADLNGDGLMEIVVHTWFDAGASVTVFTYDGSIVTEVIGTGCGA